MLFAGVSFGSSPPPPSVSQLSLFYQSSCVSPVQLTDGGRGGGGDRRGAESYNHKKAKKVWPSINCSMLSGEEDGEGEGDGD